jgi:hypothetical protein
MKAMKTRTVKTPRNTRSAVPTFEQVRHRAAVKAHASRAALAIIDGDHSDETVQRFVELDKRAQQL